MTISSEYKAFIEELFEPFGPVRIRNMFGGAGIYADLPDGPVMFGLIADETVYLKADDGNRAQFEAEDCGPFIYADKTGKELPMSYYRLPDHLYEDGEALKTWAREALSAALRSGVKAKKRKKPKP